MFLYFPAIFQSFLFALILEVMFFYKGFFWVVLLFFLIFSVATYRLTTKTWKGIFIGIVFFSSIWTILHLIDYDIEKQIFILISTLVNYFLFFGVYRVSTKSDSRTAKAVVSMSLMAIVFLFFAATYGIYLNFDVSAWALMFFYFIGIAVLSHQYFSLIGVVKEELIFLYSLVLGFVSLEMAWVVNFWPFGYLTTGVVLLMFYYVIWDLVQNYFLNIISIKKVVVNLIFFLVASSIVLYSSIWLPNI